MNAILYVSAIVLYICATVALLKDEEVKGWLHICNASAIVLFLFTCKFSFWAIEIKEKIAPGVNIYVTLIVAICLAIIGITGVIARLIAKK